LEETATQSALDNFADGNFDQFLEKMSELISPTKNSKKYKKNIKEKDKRAK